MATMTAEVENQKARLDNHAERISEGERQRNEDRLRSARTESAIEAASSLKRWVATFIVSALALGVAALGFLLNLLKTVQELKGQK